MVRVGDLLTDLPSRLRRITSGGTYRPEIDGLRFFAIAIVVLGHFVQRVMRAEGEIWGPVLIPEPGLGVLLFFAVSGFILGAQFLKQSRSALSPAFLRHYFVRRITRIEPPYILILFATYVVLISTGFDPGGAAGQGGEPKSLTLSLLASVFYSHGWLFGTMPRLMPPGWSLEIEVQFYIIAPLLFFIYFKLRDRMLRAVVGVSALVVIYAAAEALRTASPGSIHWEYMLPKFLMYFWVGIMMADFQESIRDRFCRPRPALASAAAWVGLAALLASPCLPAVLPAGGRVLEGALVATVLASIVAMFCGTFAEGSFRRFCAAPWISLIGSACYSIYLTHLQIIQIMTQIVHRTLDPAGGWGALILHGVLQLPLVLAVGLVFYALIERPFMTPGWPALVGAWVRRRIRPA